MRAGDWKKWRTPREYKRLDGTGRKLMLYDNTRMAITIEVEIQKVTGPHKKNDYPWTNVFVRDKLLVFEDPWIPLSRILEIPGFENFATARSAFMILTQEQYRQLKENRSEANA